MKYSFIITAVVSIALISVIALVKANATTPVMPISCTTFTDGSKYAPIPIGCGLARGTECPAAASNIYYNSTSGTVKCYPDTAPEIADAAKCQIAGGTDTYYSSDLCQGYIKGADIQNEYRDTWLKCKKGYTLSGNTCFADSPVPSPSPSPSPSPMPTSSTCSAQNKALCWNMPSNGTTRCATSCGIGENIICPTGYEKTASINPMAVTCKNDTVTLEGTKVTPPEPISVTCAATQATCKSSDKQRCAKTCSPTEEVTCPSGYEKTESIYGGGNSTCKNDVGTLEGVKFTKKIYKVYDPDKNEMTVCDPATFDKDKAEFQCTEVTSDNEKVFQLLFAEQHKRKLLEGKTAEDQKKIEGKIDEKIRGIQPSYTTIIQANTEEQCSQFLDLTSVTIQGQKKRVLNAANILTRQPVPQSIVETARLKVALASAKINDLTSTVKGKRCPSDITPMRSTMAEIEGLIDDLENARIDYQCSVLEKRENALNGSIGKLQGRQDEIGRIKSETETTVGSRKNACTSHDPFGLVAVRINLRSLEERVRTFGTVARTAAASQKQAAASSDYVRDVADNIQFFIEASQARLEEEPACAAVAKDVKKLKNARSALVKAQGKKAKKDVAKFLSAGEKQEKELLKKITACATD